MNLYMETTKIGVEKTVNEIGCLLAEAGARAILTEYDGNRKISSLSFKLQVGDRMLPFNLPARIKPVFTCLQKKRSPKYRDRKSKEDLAQAERVAWRQLLRWAQAQLALIDTGMVSADEVFLPYIQTGMNQTLYEKLLSSGQLGRLALPEGK